MRGLDHLAVLVPDPSNVRIYVRRYADQHLRFVRKADCIETLYDVIQELPSPRLAVFVGSSYHGYLESLILTQDTALCIIPGAWVRHIPLADDSRRANFAVQLLEAHVNEPIQLMRSKQDLPL